jgi:hypothetical protein
MTIQGSNIFKRHSGPEISSAYYAYINKEPADPRADRIKSLPPLENPKRLYN